MRLHASLPRSRSGLTPGQRAHWALTLYPDAGEAGGCLVVPRRSHPDEPRTSDPERAQAEAARRARGKLRRYCAANRLNRLGTLTYAGQGCHDARELRYHLGGFFRGLRRELGEERMPYVWVPEPHPGGHGLHAHFAVGRYVKQSLIKKVWARGHVHIKLLGDLPVGSASLEEARLAARYLAKYASKSLDDERPAGLHRYEVAQGFQPRALRLRGHTTEDAIRQASEVMGHAPSTVWRSEEAGSDGPPTCWVSW